jgi:hypothetical protein
MLWTHADGVTEVETSFMEFDGKTLKVVLPWVT